MYHTNVNASSVANGSERYQQRIDTILSALEQCDFAKAFFELCAVGSAYSATNERVRLTREHSIALFLLMSAVHQQRDAFQESFRAFVGGLRCLLSNSRRSMSAIKEDFKITHYQDILTQQPFWETRLPIFHNCEPKQVALQEITAICTGAVSVVIGADFQQEAMDYLRNVSKQLCTTLLNATNNKQAACRLQNNYPPIKQLLSVKKLDETADFQIKFLSYAWIHAIGVQLFTTGSPKVGQLQLPKNWLSEKEDFLNAATLEDIETADEVFTPLDRSTLRTAPDIRVPLRQLLVKKSRLLRIALFTSIADRQVRSILSKYCKPLSELLYSSISASSNPTREQHIALFIAIEAIGINTIANIQDPNSVFTRLGDYLIGESMKSNTEGEDVQLRKNKLIDEHQRISSDFIPSLVQESQLTDLSGLHDRSCQEMYLRFAQTIRRKLGVKLFERLLNTNASETAKELVHTDKFRKQLEQFPSKPQTTDAIPYTVISLITEYIQHRFYYGKNGYLEKEPDFAHNFYLIMQMVTWQRMPDLIILCQQKAEDFLGSDQLNPPNITPDLQLLVLTCLGYLLYEVAETDFTDQQRKFYNATERLQQLKKLVEQHYEELTVDVVQSALTLIIKKSNFKLRKAPRQPTSPRRVSISENGSLFFQPDAQLHLTQQQIQKIADCHTKFLYLLRSNGSLITFKFMMYLVHYAVFIPQAVTACTLADRSKLLERYPVLQRKVTWDTQAIRRLPRILSDWQGHKKTIPSMCPEQRETVDELVELLQDKVDILQSCISSDNSVTQDSDLPGNRRRQERTIYHFMDCIWPHWHSASSEEKSDSQKISRHMIKVCLLDCLAQCGLVRYSGINFGSDERIKEVLRQTFVACQREISCISKGLTRQNVTSCAQHILCLLYFGLKHHKFNLCYELVIDRQTIHILTCYNRQAESLLKPFIAHLIDFRFECADGRRSLREIQQEITNLVESDAQPMPSVSAHVS